LTAEQRPFEYAAAQTKLGIAYSDLPAGDRAANLTRAITCYQEALRVWTFETAPFDYAGVQTNLGKAYFELLQGTALPI